MAGNPKGSRKCSIELFRDVCAALYGKDFRLNQICEDFNIERRTVRRWFSGDRLVPEGVIDELIVACNDRVLLFNELLARLDECSKSRV